MIKRAGVGNGQVEVTFEVDAAVQAERANLCGEFNDWSQTADEMERKPDGGFTLTKNLEGGRSYRFRYLLDGERWENDWAADAYVPNEYGRNDSVVEVSDVTRIDLTAQRVDLPADDERDSTPSVAEFTTGEPTPHQTPPSRAT